MTLNNKIIEKLKQSSGLLFDKAGDFDLLSDDIFKKTERTIGITTLKRLFNYIYDDRKTNEYTLNTIALYLGYSDWSTLTKDINIDSAWNFDDDTVYVHALDLGTKVEVTYLDRCVQFVVTQRNGQNILSVKKVENSSLKVGDECEIYQIRKGEILEAKQVYRGKSIGNYRTNGEVSSVKCYN